MTACPGCGRTTSTTFQELAERTQDYIRERMPEWKTQYEGVETMTLAVMGCVVNGPGESKAASIGISLPGTGEAPNCPVYIDGQHHTTLRGTYEELAIAFRELVDNYVETRYPKKAQPASSACSAGLAGPRRLQLERVDPPRPHHQQRDAADDQADRQPPPQADHAEAQRRSRARSQVGRPMNQWPTRFQNIGVRVSPSPRRIPVATPWMPSNS